MEGEISENTYILGALIKQNLKIKLGQMAKIEFFEIF